MRPGEPRADWSRYNFVENLFVSGLMPSRGVPAESGVRFFVDSAVREEGVCLVFQVDWRGNPPLISDKGIKPDYVVLFIPWSGPWLATIVEMKGRNHQELAHGIKQIQAFHARCRAELAECLPAWIRLEWQGLLLHAENASVPAPDLVKTQRSACPIRAVRSRSNHKTDLYPLVRRRVAPAEKVEAHEGKNLGAPGCFNPLEQALVVAERGGGRTATRGGVHLDLGSLNLALDRDPGTASLTARQPLPELCEALKKFSPECHQRWTFQIPDCAPG